MKKFTNAVVKALKESGAVEIKKDSVLIGRRFRLQTAQNFITVRIDEDSKHVLSIFGRYDTKPPSRANSKNNFHWNAKNYGMACAMMEDYIFDIQQL